MNRRGKRESLPISGENTDIKANLHKKGGKSGRAGTRTPDITDVNPENWVRIRDVILLKVERFNN
jgi:hypothetical protein